MNTRSLVALLVTAWVPTWASAQPAPVAPQALTVEGAVTHVYKSVGNVELRLHVFSPAGHAASSRAPAIVFFFGGGWTSGSVQQFVPQSQHLSSKGMVAIVADYRVFGRHGTGPAEAIADAKSAIRWVRAHATELGVDPGRIAAGGGSAGGHIALSAAVFDGFNDSTDDRTVSARPDALVLLNPAVDVAKRPEEFSARFGGRAQDVSPLQHIRAGLPPAIILHGKADATVPYDDVERFSAASTKAGNRCQLVGYEGATHGFFNPGRDGGKWYRETLAEAERFLTALGYLPAAYAAQDQL